MLEPFMLIWLCLMVSLCVTVVIGLLQHSNTYDGFSCNSFTAFGWVLWLPCQPMSHQYHHEWGLFFLPWRLWIIFVCSLCNSLRRDVTLYCLNHLAVIPFANSPLDWWDLYVSPTNLMVDSLIHCTEIGERWDEEWFLLFLFSKRARCGEN